jgi:tripartite-type tricarboxylate transporter receptor subunit TctC
MTLDLGRDVMPFDFARPDAPPAAGTCLFAALRRTLTCVALFVLFPASCFIAFAATYPERPIRLIVPFPAGSPLDARARQLANHLPPLLGQQVVVDNRGGASGIIAMELAAKAPADGYTVLFANSTQLASNPAMVRKLPYDVFKDYAPVTLLARTPSLFVVSNTVPAKSLGEMIALAKAKPRQLNYASQGSGTVQHVAGELFMRLTGTEMVHVPYKTYSQLLSELFSGQVALIIGGTPVLIPHVKAGRLRALAVNTPKRIPALPDVPTFDESGVPNFWPAPWYGVLVPPGTPARTVNVLNGAFNRTLKAHNVIEIAAAEGQTLLGTSPAEFSAFIKVEFERYQRLIKDTGILVN